MLSSQRLAGVRDAISGGNRLDMIREAHGALEDLCARGLFRRGGVTHSYNTSYISYIRVSGGTRITLEMSRSELSEVTGGGGRDRGILPSVLAGIISSLALNNSSRAVPDRIMEILDLSARILSGARSHLILLRDPPFPADRAGERIHVTSWSDFSQNRFYRACVTSGISHTFIRLDGAFSGSSLFTVEPATRSIALIPVVSDEVKWGILEVHFASDAPPDRNAFFNFQLIGQGVTRLLENNVHLEKLVSVDRLTQVHNRNYYDEQLPLEMERATRNKKYLGFLMIDIDDFKNINDTHGHDAGDEILKVVAHTIRDHLRKIDLLFRYGGEEFIALLPGAGEDAARRTAERIREIVETTHTELHDGTKLGVTISIGGCIFPTDAQNELELFRRSDQALYVSKREGKNRITFFEE
jgi:diguanylate cyclase (GGDEF)-like protein